MAVLRKEGFACKAVAEPVADTRLRSRFLEARALMPGVEWLRRRALVREFAQTSDQSKRLSPFAVHWRRQPNHITERLDAVAADGTIRRNQPGAIWSRGHHRKRQAELNPTAAETPTVEAHRSATTLGYWSFSGVLF